MIIVNVLDLSYENLHSIETVPLFSVKFSRKDQVKAQVYQMSINLFISLTYSIFRDLLVAPGREI